MYAPLGADNLTCPQWFQLDKPLGRRLCRPCDRGYWCPQGSGTPKAAIQTCSTRALSVNPCLGLSCDTGYTGYKCWDCDAGYFHNATDSQNSRCDACTPYSAPFFYFTMALGALVLVVGGCAFAFWTFFLPEKLKKDLMQKWKGLKERIHKVGEDTKDSEKINEAVSMLKGAAVSAWKTITAYAGFTQSDIVRSMPQLIWPYSFDSFAECAIPVFKFYFRYIAALCISGAALLVLCGYLLYQRLQEQEEQGAGVKTKGNKQKLGGSNPSAAPLLEDVRGKVDEKPMVNIILPAVLAMSFRSLTCIPLEDGSYVLFGEPNTSCTPLSQRVGLDNAGPLAIGVGIALYYAYRIAKGWRELSAAGGKGVGAMDDETRLCRLFELVAAATALVRMLLAPLAMINFDAVKVWYFLLTAITTAASIILLRNNVIKRLESVKAAAAKKRGKREKAAEEKMDEGKEREKFHDFAVAVSTVIISYFSGFFSDALVLVSDGPAASFFSDFLPSTLPLYLPWLFLVSFIVPFAIILSAIIRSGKLREMVNEKAEALQEAVRFMVYGDKDNGVSTAQLQDKRQGSGGKASRTIKVRLGACGLRVISATLQSRIPDTLPPYPIIACIAEPPRKGNNAEKSSAQ